MFVTFIDFSHKSTFVVFVNLTTIDILVLLSWIPASKEFFEKKNLYYQTLQFLSLKVGLPFLWISVVAQISVLLQKLNVVLPPVPVGVNYFLFYGRS